jgi:uncharacterized protein (DUF885 family)
VVAQLRTLPETTTGLGLDNGELAWTKSKLGDRSATALADGAARTAQQLGRLRALDRRTFSGMDAVNYDTVEFVLDNQDETNRKFTYGAGAAGVPYVLSQLSGAYQAMPDFLDTQHLIETKADADAYLSRLEGFARLMDQECAIARRDYAEGVIPPDFILDRTLVQMKSLASAPTAEASRKSKARTLPPNEMGPSLTWSQSWSRRPRARPLPPPPGRACATQDADRPRRCTDRPSCATGPGRRRSGVKYVRYERAPSIRFDGESAKFQSARK